MQRGHREAPIARPGLGRFAFEKRWDVVLDAYREASRLYDEFEAARRRMETLKPLPGLAEPPTPAAAEPPVPACAPAPAPAPPAPDSAVPPPPQPAATAASPNTRATASRRIPRSSTECAGL